MLIIAAGSKAYVKSRVKARSAGAAVNPTADTVKVAFVATGASPAGSDFKTASWETDATTSPPTYWARCLVGPGGDVTLAAGTYQMWVQVSDNPEVPVLHAGPVKVV